MTHDPTYNNLCQDNIDEITDDIAWALKITRLIFSKEVGYHQNKILGNTIKFYNKLNKPDKIT